VTMFENSVLCHCENSAPHRLKNVTFVKGVTDFVNPEDVPTLIVLDGLMHCAYSTSVSKLFSKGSHHRYVSLILIKQNLFHKCQSARVVSLNCKYVSVFKNPRHKNQIVHLAQQVYPENISRFQKIYLDVCKDPHIYSWT
jgi:hypothetical protein